MPDDAADVIGPDEELWRRVHHKQWVEDRTTGEWRVSSGAFRDLNLSVDRASIVRAAGLDHRYTQRHAPAVASFTVALALELGQEVRPDPNPPEDPNNDAHALVCGPKPRSTCNGLRLGSRVLT